MNISFEGKVVLITGATRGIGKQIADDFSALGAQLILTGTNDSEICDLNEKVSGASEKKEYFAVNFTDATNTQSFINNIAKFKKIDICINNAGINRINYIDETLDRDWTDMLNVNLEAPFLITREVAKLMKKNRYGRIINISSIFGVLSKEKRSIYSVTKFGLRGLTVASAIDLASYNILVNSVSPGFVQTDLTESILGKEEMDSLVSQVPMGRFALPEEISRVVMFLASDLNTYITGQNIIADGGFVCV